MSDGKTHAMVTTSLIAPVGVGAFIMTNDIETAVFAAVGCSFNIVCGPDLDQQGVTRNETALLHSWLWPFGVVWVMIWFPYAFAIPHRSPLSHLPVLGSIVRDVYLTAVIVIILWLIDLILHALIPTFQIDVLTAVYDRAVTITPAFVFAFVMGQICADTGHFFADVISTKRKRSGRKRKNRRNKKQQRRLWSLRRSS